MTKITMTFSHTFLCSLITPPSLFFNRKSLNGSTATRNKKTICVSYASSSKKQYKMTHYLFEPLATNLLNLTNLHLESHCRSHSAHDNHGTGRSRRFVYDTLDWVYGTPLDMSL